MNRPLISIIIPFFNSESYLERAIKSVLNQKYKDWELLLVNDGSRDKSPLIANKYCKLDKRIQLLSKENGGYSTAVNCGLRNLSKESEYFMILGSDDEISLNLLEDVSLKIGDKHPDIIGFRTLNIRDYSNSVDYRKDTLVNNDIFSFGTDIISFYNDHPDIPKLFLNRDSSRLYKTSQLGALTYYGKYGNDSDSVFSMMFSLKCESFSHLVDGDYLWHVRKDSVSYSSLNLDKIIDILDVWNLFFNFLLDNNFVSLSKFIQGSFIKFCDTLITLLSYNSVSFKLNKTLIFKSRYLIKKLIKTRLFKLSVKKKIIVYFPRLCWPVLLIAGHNKKTKICF